MKLYGIVKHGMYFKRLPWDDEYLYHVPEGQRFNKSIFLYRILDGEIFKIDPPKLYDPSQPLIIDEEIRQARKFVYNDWLFYPIPEWDFRPLPVIYSALGDPES